MRLSLRCTPWHGLETDPDPTFADVNGTGLNQISDLDTRPGACGHRSGRRIMSRVSDPYAVFVNRTDEVEFTIMPEVLGPVRPKIAGEHQEAHPAAPRPGHAKMFVGDVQPRWAVW